MNITFSDTELLARATIAVQTWYLQTIQTIGKQYFSQNPSTRVDGEGLKKVKDAFLTKINGVGFDNAVAANIDTFCTNATASYLATKPPTADTNYATHPLVVLESQIRTLAAPAIQAAVAADLPAAVNAKMDELVTPASIQTYVAQVLTPASISGAIAEIVNPAYIKTAVQADVPAAVQLEITSQKIAEAVQTVLTPAALLVAVNASVNAQITQEAVTTALGNAVATYIQANAATVMAQIAANKLQQSISIVVDGVIASTVNPTLDPNGGTVTP